MMLERYTMSTHKCESLVCYYRRYYPCLVAASPRWAPQVPQVIQATGGSNIQVLFSPLASSGKGRLRK